MKPKWIFMVLAGLMICSIFSISHGANRFYFGSYGGEDHASDLRDSLRFNIVRAMTPSIYIDSLASHGMRAIVLDGDTTSPSHWSWISHYTLWEAEGLQGSYVNLLYNGGTVVNDPYASGGKARKFSRPSTPGIIQTGPSYYQEPGGEYTAEFRLKLRYSLYQPRGAMSGEPPTAVCSIMVVDALKDTILKARTLYKNEFPNGGGYKTFLLGPYTVPDVNRIEFQIYWFAIPEAEDFRVDYVKVYDDNGRILMSGQKDQAIIAYVSQSWVTKPIQGTGEPVVYRWYMRDQPTSIDFYMPTRYIDNLLKDVSYERVGFQAFCRVDSPLTVHEYLLRQNPSDFCVDIYPMESLGTNTAGYYYQQKWSKHIERLNFTKTEADSLHKDFWLVPQAFTTAHRQTSNCPYLLIHWGGKDYCPFHRDPSRYELRLQTFLGLCYGSDGILYYPYTWWVNNNGNLETGLYDPEGDSTTYKWREIKEFTGPRVEKLGPILKQLTWQGACSSDSVGSFIFRNGADTSYINNIVPKNHYPPYVEVGFFTHGDTNYFMLVNRRCLPEEGDTFRVFLEQDTTPRNFTVWDMYADGDVADLPECGYKYDFPVYLGPGEGRLFQLFVPSWSPQRIIIHVPSPQYPTIQAGINAAQGEQTVLVDTGTYHENIDFRGRGILVTSKFHTTGDTSYISRTIIDGSIPSNQDSASVVRFISIPGSCACIKGFTLKYGSGTKTYTKDLTPTNKGGGIMCLNSSPTITNNIIISNSADGGSGGGIYCDYSSSPKIINNVIKGNRAYYGGGIEGGSPQAIIANNLIVQNKAHQGGGIDMASGIITNNTIDQDSAFLAGGIHVAGLTTCQIVNNVVVNSKGGRGIWCGGIIPKTISYNDVWNNSGGNFYCSGYGDTTDTNRNGTPCDSFYNIIRDPKFVDGYHLDGSSPCINAGDNNAPALPPTDFDGDPIVADKDANCLFFVDMGAYEYQPGGFKGFGKIVGGGREDTETKSSGEIPDKFSLLQNYPNPFNPTTIVQFKIPQPAKVTLKVYNILGQLVRILVDEEKPTGIYQSVWDGKDAEGKDVASGIYFYRLQTGEYDEVRKMTLVK
jgi:hypothetical protein